jgi:archaemetzincin
MEKLIIYLLLLLGVFNADQKITYNQRTIVHIVPLGDVKQKYLNHVKESISKFYPNIKCVIDKPVKLTDDILAKSGTRYEASKILAKYNSKRNVILITEKDIAHFNRERNIKEYGIIGLGLRPGKVCVVSTFRIKKSSKFLSRLQKVSIHEIGHNLNIPHCENNRDCLMHAAEGSVRQIDREKIWICNECRNKVNLSYLN